MTGNPQRVAVVLVEVVAVVEVAVAGPPSLSSPPAEAARAAPARATAPTAAGTTIDPSAALIALPRPAAAPVGVPTVGLAGGVGVVVAVSPVSVAAPPVPGALVVWAETMTGASMRATDRAKTAVRTMKLPSVSKTGPRP